MGINKLALSRMQRHIMQDKILTITFAILGTLTTFYVISAVWMLTLSFTLSDVVPQFSHFSLRNIWIIIEQPRWHTIIGNIFIYVFLTNSIGCIVGYFCAIALHRRIMIHNHLRLVILLPLSISFVVTGAIWQEIFSHRCFGASNIPTLINGICQNWTKDPRLSIFAVAVAGSWQQLGFYTMILSVGMNRIRSDVWRAMTIDGAGFIRQYLLVAGPMMLPFFAIAWVIGAANGFRTYDLVLALTAGGPGFSSDMPAHFVLEQIFERQDLALGAAAASSMFIVSLVLYGTLRYIIKYWQV